MKRKLSLLLAVVMIITMLPMTVFARSENTINRQPSVTEDYEFTVSDAPVLQIKQKTAIVAGDTQVFQLTLTNAEWEDSNGNFLLAPAGYTSGSVAPKSNVISTSLVGGSDTGFTVRRISATVAEITYNPGTAAANGPGIPYDGSIYISLLSVATDEGSLTVTIDSRDSEVASGTYTYATCGAGDTKTTSSSKTISDKATELNNIIVDEVAIGSMYKSGDPSFTFTLTAPSNFKFTGVTSPVTGSGAYAGVDGTARVSDDDEITVTINKLNVTSATTRGSIIIEGVTIKPLDNASEGDVYLRISGNRVTRETFKVGEFKTYGVSFEAEDKTLPVLVTGRYAGRGTEDVDHETLKVKFKENVTNSWMSERKTVISVPDGVRIIGVDIDKDTNLQGTSSLTGYYPVDYDGSAYGGSVANVAVEQDKITLSDVLVQSGKKAEVDMIFYLSVSISYTGDIDLLCNGAAIGEDLTTTVSTTLTPVTVETARNEVKIGYKSVPVHDIIITENIEGAVQKKVYDYEDDNGNAKKANAALELWIADGLGFKDVAKAEVTSGDFEIDDIQVEGGSIRIYPDRESSKASTIKLSGVTMDIDRTPPEGFYALKVGGEAIVTNFTTNRTVANTYAQFGYVKTSKHAAIEVADVFNVITAAPGSDNTWTTAATVTIGSDQIVCSDGRVVTMDAPAYIKDGRTMMPIRSVSVALGIDDSNVWWNGETRTASVRSVNGGIVTVVMGDKNVYIGGVAVFGMDTTPEIVNGRVFVPVAALANALGVSYSWDATARTVVFNNTTAATNLSVSQ